MIALVLGHAARDLVGVDDEAERSEALHHADQLVAACVIRERIRSLELLQHVLEILFEPPPVERLD